jgi:hypothetical protein
MGLPGRGDTVVEARPPVALKHDSSPWGQEREESAGNPSRASPELGQWCGGQAMAVK